MHKQKNKRKTLILLSILFIVLIVLAVNSTNNKERINELEDNNVKNYDENSIIGSFIYKVDGTKYEFKSDGNGSMSSKSFNYEYKYTTQDNNLNIDFIADEVQDVKYTYSINGNTLTLISVDGTVSTGEEYKLEKENK